ncbi:hypothetical protein SDJN03_12792, partial [Cucurbita argyrosperma subsp. sororia]
MVAALPFDLSWKEALSSSTSLFCLNTNFPAFGSVNDQFQSNRSSNSSTDLQSGLAESDRRRVSQSKRKISILRFKVVLRAFGLSTL